MSVSDEELMEKVLAEQIPEAPEETPQSEAPQEEAATVEEQPKSEAAKYLNTKLSHVPGDNPFEDKEADKEMIESKKLTKIGENLNKNAEYREGWIPVDLNLLGERAIYYPSDWEFRIRPANVEAIRNWSNIDDENPNSVDEVFNEVIKSCVAIVGAVGRPISWGNISNWDRFFFLLLIREYTFRQGERKVKYNDYCPGCDNEIEFELNSQSLMFDYPDKEVMKYYDRENRCWNIDPAEFEIEGEEPIQLYIPTLEKDNIIKNWIIGRVQENRNYKIDQTFLRFVNWMTPKLSKDATIAARQIRELNLKYKSWNEEMFSFMDDVIRNIIVTPSNKLVTNCPICGEEVTSNIRFPKSIKELFSYESKFRKFGKK